MIIGKVVGNIVSTRKNEKLIGCKLMVIEPLSGMEGAPGRMIAADHVGAGIGEMVLIALGSAARIGMDKESAPIDAAIVGIVDSGTGLSGDY